ncbi:alpha/beta hydrolase [Bradyrhizobium sp. Gha]|uniref:alpha/beta hydrolase family protein n=1 Tax=Bradyrhizobium sp. Gha TaxID=1855318 RepID=UPI0008EA2170|nr:alpha/beta hydrolase [Bradyrhizobium sp. Gha]SFJ72446.1 Alpha/beta hydrolase of unknown function [Bradyrhizobium sp. Gha]
MKIRRTLLEIRVANAVLDALKQQYGFKRFHLVGHSGGGHTVAGLVQLRTDIGCAVIASAAISLRSQMRDSGHPIVGQYPYYDPIDHVDVLKQRPDLRLFVVSDRNDKVVSYRSQLEFVERVKAYNLSITQVTATATDKNSHDLFYQGLRLAVDCAHREYDLINAPSGLSERAITVKKGESVATILRDLGASAEDISALTAVLGARGRDGGLREGETLRVLFAANAGRSRVVRVVVVGESEIEAVVALSDSSKYVSIAPGAFSGVLAPPPAHPNPPQLAPPAWPSAVALASVGPVPSNAIKLLSADPGAVPPAAAPPVLAKLMAQKVVLYDEDPSDPKGKQYVGSVVWRLEPIKASGNQKAGVAVRADIEIPDRKFKMTMSFRRNTDSSLLASHTAELTFILPPDFPGGSVSNVPGILMKSNQQARGTPLAGLLVKVTDGFFLVGLSNLDADRARNVQLLKERSWFDVPLVYANQRRAIIAFEKGEPGERAFKDALTAWAED